MRNQDEISRNHGLGRNMNDGEVDALAVLIDRIKSIAIKPSEPDRIVWIWNSKGIFSIRSFYKHLTSTTHYPLPAIVLWGTCLPSKVTFFVWTSILDKRL